LSYTEHRRKTFRSFQGHSRGKTQTVKLVSKQLTLNDKEKYKTLSSFPSEELSSKGSIEGTSATYNKASNWLSITFAGVPAAEVRSELKSKGFRYEPYSKRWRAAFTTDREDALKKMAGAVESVDIKTNWAAKAEHASNMAAKHEEKSNEAYERSSKIADAIPFGQPILVGHHSEAHHRADLARIDNAMKKSVEENKIAESYQERAERYGRKATGENPATVYNRIKKLEADKRRMERELAAGETKEGTLYYSGSISPARKAEIQRWITHYDQRLTVERENYKASGGIATDSLALKAGDIVKTRFGPGVIASVSEKTARVKIGHGGIYEDKSGNSLLAKSDILGLIKAS
jgi:hypothetical protein